MKLGGRHYRFDGDFWIDRKETYRFIIRRGSEPATNVHRNNELFRSAGIVASVAEMDET